MRRILNIANPPLSVLFLVGLLFFLYPTIEANKKADAQTTRVGWYYSLRSATVGPYETQTMCQDAYNRTQGAVNPRSNACFARATTDPFLSQASVERTVNPGGQSGGAAGTKPLVEKDCGLLGWKCLADLFTTGIDAVVAALLELVGLLFAGLMVVAGYLFDWSIYLSIFKLKEFTPDSSVGQAWKIVRDLLNLFLIFWVVWIGIKTILGLDDFKKIIPYIIIFALLTNFSLFFSKLIVDGTNILALQFYAKVLPGSSGGAVNIGDAPSFTNGIGANLINKLGTHSIDTTKGAGGRALFEGVGARSGGALMKIIILIITTFLLLQGAFLFLKRSAMLVFLLVFSPLMFAQNLIPSVTGYAKKWWGEFWCEAIFAPIFMFMLYLVFQVIGERGGAGGVGSGILGFTVGGGGFFATIFSYAIVVTMLYFIMNTSKEVACATGGVVMGAANSVGKMLVGGVGVGALGAAGRATLGRGAAAITQSKWAQDHAAKNTLGISRALFSFADKTSKASFDIRASEIAKKGIGAVGIPDLGAARGAGGHVGRIEEKQKERMKEREELKKRIEITDEQLEDRIVDVRKRAELEREVLKPAQMAAYSTANEEGKKRMLKKAWQDMRDEQFLGSLDRQTLLEQARDLGAGIFLGQEKATYNEADKKMKKKIRDEKVKKQRGVGETQRQRDKLNDLRKTAYRGLRPTTPGLTLQDMNNEQARDWWNKQLKEAEDNLKILEARGHPGVGHPDAPRYEMQLKHSLKNKRRAEEATREILRLAQSIENAEKQS